MRVIVLLLVLANLLFFAWANWIDRPAPRARTAPVPALQLAPASGTRAGRAAARCRSLGPYADESGAAAATATLTRRGITARARRVDATVNDGYWVYLVAPEPALQQRMLQQLARAGVRDAAVVASDAAGARVSAGVFSEQQGAEERAAAVRRAGLEPVLEARHRTTSAWWLDLRLSATDVAPRPDDAELGGGSAVLQWRDCPQ